MALFFEGKFCQGIFINLREGGFQLPDVEIVLFYLGEGTQHKANDDHQTEYDIIIQIKRPYPSIFKIEIIKHAADNQQGVR